VGLQPAEPLIVLLYQRQIMMTYDSGGMTNAEIVTKAREIAVREIERRQQQASR
jgi:hypothetical protein